MKENDYGEIENLYYSWLNEHDFVAQLKKKDEIKNKVSPYDFLHFCSQYSSPETIFRNIFTLRDFFLVLKQMQEQGEDIRRFTNKALLIHSFEDIEDLKKIIQTEISSEISEMILAFEGTNIFEYDDLKSIGEKFPRAYVRCLSLEQIEQMMNYPKDYKGIPINITIDNVGELSLETISEIEKHFDIGSIQIVSKDRLDTHHQGEQIPLTLATYKEIRTIVDDIIEKLYVKESGSKFQLDYQLAVQIVDILANMLEYDFETAEEVGKSNISNKSSNNLNVSKASSMVALLTKLVICKGDAEILRNILNCVGIEAFVIDGEMTGTPHSWCRVKLGEEWFNIDITNARQCIIDGKTTGELFMSDEVFFGPRRNIVFDKGRQQECLVRIGGHSTNISKLNGNQCKNNISPLITLNAIKVSKIYESRYEKNGKNEDYKGVVPYVGSKVEKERSKTRNIKVFDDSSTR